MNSTVDVSHLTNDSQAQRILQMCHRVNTEMSPEISLQSFQDGYRNWKVGTSTSPSGRHLSHQHILFQPHGIKLSDPESITHAEQARDNNWRLQHGLVSYALKYGYCLRRWQQVVTTMIEKEPGNPKLHWLRVIHLYESDFT